MGMYKVCEFTFLQRQQKRKTIRTTAAISSTVSAARAAAYHLPVPSGMTAWVGVCVCLMGGCGKYRVNPNTTATLRDTPAHF